MCGVSDFLIIVNAPLQDKKVPWKLIPQTQDSTKSRRQKKDLNSPPDSPHLSSAIFTKYMTILKLQKNTLLYYCRHSSSFKLKWKMISTSEMARDRLKKLKTSLRLHSEIHNKVPSNQNQNLGLREELCPLSRFDCWANDQQIGIRLQDQPKICRGRESIQENGIQANGKIRVSPLEKKERLRDKNIRGLRTQKLSPFT